MNAIRLTQTIVQSCVHHLIDLKAFDPTLPKFFEDSRDVRLARSRWRVHARVVRPKLQDDDFCPVWNGAGKSSQHFTRSVSGHTFIRHTEAGAPGLQHRLELGRIGLSHADATSQRVACAEGDDLCRRRRHRY